MPFTRGGVRNIRKPQEELQDIEDLKPGEQDVEASESEPDEEQIEEEEKEEPLVIRRCFTIPVDLNDDIDMINRELGSTFSSIVRVAFSDPKRYRVLLETAKRLEAGMSLEKLGKLAEERKAELQPA